MQDAPLQALDLSECCRRLRVSRQTLWHLTKSGDLPSFTVGRRRLILEADLRAFIEANREPPAGFVPEGAA